jgi:hypothetical protein
MPQSVEEWRDQHAARELARQTSQLETAKLLVTFTAGISATLVATALQVGEHAINADRWACAILAASFAFAVATIGLDRSKSPNHAKASLRREQNGWTEEAGAKWLDRRTVLTVFCGS